MKAMEGLQDKDFLVTDHEVPRTLCGFAHVRQPLSLGIILDKSGSMGAYPKQGRSALSIAKAGINRLLDGMGPNDEFFLEDVSTEPAMQVLFTHDVARIRVGLEVKPRGRTALVDGIYLALHGMRKASHANQALLIVSDAFDNQSVYTSEELARAFSDFPVPIFLVIPLSRWRNENQPPGENPLARRTLVEFANRSGGITLPVHDLKEMLAITAELDAALRSPYILYFSRPSTSLNQAMNLRVETKGLRPRPILSYGPVIACNP